MKKDNSTDRVNDFVTESGSGVVQLYRGVLQSNGTIDLVEDGKKDLYAEIQSYKDSVDINVIVYRYLNGDIDVLNQRSAVYQDVSEIPKNRAQILQTINDARVEFDRLPVNIKNNFGNSFETWFSTFGSDDFMRLMSPGQDPGKVISEDEVKVDES